MQELQNEPTCPTYEESDSDVPIASSSDRTAEGIFDGKPQLRP
jgi:hypothetical protein